MKGFQPRPEVWPWAGSGAGAGAGALETGRGRDILQTQTRTQGHQVQAKMASRYPNAPLQCDFLTQLLGAEQALPLGKLSLPFRAKTLLNAKRKTLY